MESRSENEKTTTGKAVIATYLFMKTGAVVAEDVKVQDASCG